MKVLIGMECSQVIQQAFKARGHKAVSCDFKPGTVDPHDHIQRDVHKLLREFAGYWDLIILHPPCTYLSSSGQHWTDKPGQRTTYDRDVAIEEFMRCTRYSGRVCIENPIGIMSTHYRRPDQIVQPYQYGDDASKATCLWLQGLPAIKPTAYVAPRIVDGRKRWANQHDRGQNRLGQTKGRAAARAITYRGIAEAMADQWGIL